MINLRSHLQLRSLLHEPGRFPIGVELVSTRGTMSHQQTLLARRFAEDLTHSPRIDWVSITDNAGGNPQLAPIALGTPILYSGKEVLIHLTCKDMNRHALESQLWLLASQGFHNILAMTGDYPVEGPDGRAKPVFDIDSVALLAMIRRMNDGLEVSSGASAKRLASTHFYSGAVVSPFKARENTLVPQYLKLEAKIRSGAEFVIAQIGFDARKSDELLAFLSWRGLTQTPVVGNVYVLNPRVARLFHELKIPGVVLTGRLYERCQKEAASPDKGKAFFQELAARQLAIYRGLGYSAGYLGGVHSHVDVDAILDLEKTYAPDDWKTFARELQFCRDGEFYLFDRDEVCGVSRRPFPRADWTERHGLIGDATPKVEWDYHVSRWVHDAMFSPDRPLARMGASLCRRSRDSSQCPPWLRWVERQAKRMMFDCRDCGDCSLSETAFLCPESQCAKNQRNGPCGGTRDGHCEVTDMDCIWARAYDRRKHEGRAMRLLQHAPVVQNQALRDSSSWANYWLGRDHSKSKPL